MKRKVLTICIESPLKGCSKSYWISKRITENAACPVAYIKKAKYCSKKEYEAVINYLKNVR